MKNSIVIDTDPIYRKILVLELLVKMLSVNQITGFFKM